MGEKCQLPQSAVYPNVYWTVERLLVNRRIDGPVVNFLYGTWNLRLRTYTTESGDRAYLYLKRQKGPSSTVDTEFYVFTSLHDGSKRKYLENCIKIPAMSTAKFCIWEAGLDKVMGCSSNFVRGVNFTVSFVPGSGWKQYEGLNILPTDTLQSTSSHLLQDLDRLLSSGDNADIILNCEGTAFAAHRTILMARSDRFRTMLRDKDNVNINITDLEAPVLECLLRQIYVGIMPVPASPVALDTTYAANLYRVGCLAGPILPEHSLPTPQRPQLPALQESPEAIQQNLPDATQQELPYPVQPDPRSPLRSPDIQPCSFLAAIEGSSNKNRQESDDQSEGKDPES